MTENMKVMTGCSSAKLVSKQEKWDCTLVTLDCTLEKKVNSWERMENNLVTEVNMMDWLDCSSDWLDCNLVKWDCNLEKLASTLGSSASMMDLLVNKMVM